MKRSIGKLNASPRPLHGFTLVELLVVIAIIGVLIALLLPAVQAAREAARRSQCANNLKQMALAVLNYEQAHRSLPPGGITEGACCGTLSGTNWAIAILPFIEEKVLYDRYDQDAFNEAPVNQFVREALVATYACPSDLNTQFLDVPTLGPASTYGVKYRHSSYRGVAGYSDHRGDPNDGFAYWDSGELAQHDATHFPMSRGLRGPLLGIGYANFGTVKLKHITDGTSKTLLIGEAANVTRHRRGTMWALTYTIGNKSSISRKYPQTMLGDIEACSRTFKSNDDVLCRRQWGSMHPGGLLFATCDGAVRLVSDDVNLDFLANAATIAGGETTELP